MALARRDLRRRERADFFHGNVVDDDLGIVPLAPFRGELFLEHSYTGVELQLSYAYDTLRNLQRLWNRPVHIETVLEDTRTIISFDGKDHQIEKGEPLQVAEGATI